MSTEQPEKELAETTQQINDLFGLDDSRRPLKPKSSNDSLNTSRLPSSSPSLFGEMRGFAMRTERSKPSLGGPTRIAPEGIGRFWPRSKTKAILRSRLSWKALTALCRQSEIFLPRLKKSRQARQHADHPPQMLCASGSSEFLHGRQART
jgi:hypothetical protein